MTPTPTPTHAGVACDASIETHMTDIILGMELLGLGGKCPNIYKALIELGEFFRLVVNPDEAYTPVIAQQEYAKYRALQAAKAVQAYMAKGPGTIQ